MSNRKLKKLSLHAEVLRTLNAEELESPNGGNAPQPVEQPPIKLSDRHPCPMPSRYRQLCI